MSVARADIIAPCLLAIALLASQASASGTTGKRAVLILSVPGIAPDDLTSTDIPALREIAGSGAIGWMNARAAESGGSHSRSAAGYLTLGSGAPAAAPDASGAGRIRDINALQLANRDLPHAVLLGALGDFARRAGMRPRVVGDADDTVRNSECLLLAMDSSGQVDRYIPSSVSDVREPYGVRSDLSRYVPPDVGTLTVWEFSDLFRARQYADYCLPEIADQHVRRARRRLNDLLQNHYLAAIRRFRAQGVSYRAWVLSPAPAPGAEPIDELTPVAIHGHDLGPGWLVSPTTRTVGLIANLDVTPTVAAFVGAPVPPELFGRPIQVVNGAPSTLAHWHALHRTWLLSATAQSRLGGAVFLRIGWMVLLILALWLALRTPEEHRVHQWLRPIAAACLSPVLPQVFSGFLLPVPIFLATASVVIVAVALAALAATRRLRPHVLTAIVTGILCLVVSADVLLGARHVGRSWLGHSVMYGIRYYGIGNEIAGAWLACLAVLLVTLPPRARYPLGAVLGTASALLAVLPSGGANLGAGIGMLGVAAACIVLAVPPGKRVLAGVSLVAGTVGILLALIAWTDYGAGASHLGRAVHSTQAIPGIALRKLAVNLRLVTTTRWSLLVLLGVGAVFGAMKAGERRLERRALGPLLAGALALLVANDSGVVAAGVCLSVAGPALALLIAPQRSEAPKPERVCDHGHG